MDARWIAGGKIRTPELAGGVDIDVLLDADDLPGVAVAGDDLDGSEGHFVMRGEDLAHLLVRLALLGGRGDVDLDGPVGECAADFVFLAAGDYFNSKGHFSR